MFVGRAPSVPARDPRHPDVEVHVVNRAAFCDLGEVRVDDEVLDLLPLVEHDCPDEVVFGEVDRCRFGEDLAGGVEEWWEGEASEFDSGVWGREMEGVDIDLIAQLRREEHQAAGRFGFAHFSLDSERCCSPEDGQRFGRFE